MSFLTAIMQKTARADFLPLDNIILRTVVTNVEDANDVQQPAEQGAFIYGLFCEGARWELGRGGEEGNLTE